MQSQSENHIIEIEQSGNSSDLSTPMRNKSAGVQQEYPTTQEEGDVRSLLSSIIDRKWFVMTLTILAVLTGLVVSFSMTPVYRAETIIKIDPEQTKVLEFDVSTGGEDTASEQYNRTQQRLLKSKALARMVIDEMSLDPYVAEQIQLQSESATSNFIQKMKESLGFGSNEAVELVAEPIDMRTVKPSDIESFYISNLGVEPVGKSYLLKLTYDAPDSELAASIANTHAESFIKMNLQNRVDSASHAKSFLGEELEEAKIRLDDSEKAMIAFERANRIVNAGESGSALMKQKLASLNAALTKATQQRIAAEAEFQEAGTGPARAIPAKNVVVIESAQLKALKRELVRLNKTYQENLKIYKPGYPLMTEIQTDINRVKDSIAEEQKALKAEAGTNIQVARVVAPSRKKVLGEKVRAAIANEKALQAELEKAKSTAILERDNAIKYKALEQEVNNNRELYEGLLKRKKEVGVAEGVDKNNISIVDAAVAPAGAYSPNLQLNMAVGGLLGLFLGSLLAIIMGHTDQRIKTVEDIAKISDLPVLGSFPLVKAKDRKDDAILAFEKPNSGVAEAFRTLRTNLMFATSDGLPKILHITSSEPGEGKSNTALNLAVVFAQSQKSVLLIDADLRKPSLQRYLGLSDSLGLGAYLKDGKSFDDVLTETYVKGVSVIAGKSVEGAPADLLSSDKMVELLDKASDQYDMVIVDSPPVMGLADSLVLANRSTASLVVVAGHETKQSQLTTTLNRLRLGYGNVVGFVLSKAKGAKANQYEYNYGGDHNSSDAKRIAQA